MLRDPVDVELDHVARQPERRHADQAGPAARRQRLVDIDLVAVGRELLGHRQPGRSGTDDAHALARRRRHDDVVRHVVAVVPVDQEALHGADAERLVDIGSAAGLLAGGAAHVAADRGDRVRVAGQDVALLEASLRGEHQVAAAIRVDRAAFLALDIALQPVDADFGGLEPERNGVCGDHWHRRRAGSTTSCRSASAATRWYPSRRVSVKAAGRRADLTCRRSTCPGPPAPAGRSSTRRSPPSRGRGP